MIYVYPQIYQKRSTFLSCRLIWLHHLSSVRFAQAVCSCSTERRKTKRDMTYFHSEMFKGAKYSPFPFPVFFLQIVGTIFGPFLTNQKVYFLTLGQNGMKITFKARRYWPFNNKFFGRTYGLGGSRETSNACTYSIRTLAKLTRPDIQTGRQTDRQTDGKRPQTLWQGFVCCSAPFCTLRSGA